MLWEPTSIRIFAADVEMTDHNYFVVRGMLAFIGGLLAFIGGFRRVVAHGRCRKNNVYIKQDSHSIRLMHTGQYTSGTTCLLGFSHVAANRKIC